MGYDQMCPRYEKAVEILGKKWVGLILRILMGDARRFGEFRSQAPELSDRLLSERLKELEEVGIVCRRVHNTRPVLIEYELTAKGRALEPVVQAIQGWAEKWVETPAPAGGQPE